MHHLAAFRGTLGNGAIYAQVAAVADGGLTRNQAGQYIMPENMRILAANVRGVTTSRGQVQSPSLRNIAFPEIHPVSTGAVTTVPDQQSLQTYADNGPRLLMNEAVGINATNSNGAAVSLTVAALWLAPRLISAPLGMVTTLVGNATITTIVGEWVLGTIAFETQLAAGQYAVVGMSVTGINTNYARLVFPGQTNYRPGCIVDAADGDKQYRDPFRMGRSGLFGNFLFNAPPQLEVFGHTAASTPFAVFLDVVKVG
jgi:hypothetical protein